MGTKQSETIRKNDPKYLRFFKNGLQEKPPQSITVLGYTELLERSLLSVFSSVKCPGSLIIKAHDFAQDLKSNEWTLIGGFHSPVEREILTVLLRGSAQIIICPARGLSRMLIRKAWRKPLDEGRLVFLSPFSDHVHRATAKLASERNRFVAALSKWMFVVHASRGGDLEELCLETLQSGKPIYTFQSEYSSNLIDMGVMAVSTGGELIERLYPNHNI